MEGTQMHAGQSADQSDGSHIVPCHLSYVDLQ